MKISDERIRKIKAACEGLVQPYAGRYLYRSINDRDWAFYKLSETAIPELLAEREEKQVFCEHCHTLAMCHLVGGERICGDCVHLCLDRAESAESEAAALREEIERVQKHLDNEAELTRHHMNKRLEAEKALEAVREWRQRGPGCGGLLTDLDAILDAGKGE